VTAEADAEEREFQRLYGAWATLTPTDAATLLAGFAKPWWISGGWALEAFTGSSRPHKDVDVTVFRRDVPAVRRHFAGRLDVWAVGSGALRPLDDRRPRVPGWSGQLWLRDHATGPWLLDIVLNPGGPTRWVFKRDRSITLPLDEATWVADDGLRYLRPELVLAHKLRLTRDVDDGDLAATLPLLQSAARSWLLEALIRSDPGHRWRPLLERR
jgi:Aminoglycoside-2''-adenylyltransferase